MLSVVLFIIPTDEAPMKRERFCYVYISSYPVEMMVWKIMRTTIKVIINVFVLVYAEMWFFIVMRVLHFR